MAAKNVTIRMDEDLKRKAEDLFSDLGLNLTTAFTIFAKQAVREQRIPFEITRDVPNDDTVQAMKEVIKMKKDASYGKTYSDVDDMMKELLK